MQQPARRQPTIPENADTLFWKNVDLSPKEPVRAKSPAEQLKLMELQPGATGRTVQGSGLAYTDAPNGDLQGFCTEEQVPAEVAGCLELVKIVLNTLGMKDYRVRVGLRDPDSAKYVGQADQWDRAETACKDAAATLGVPYTLEPGAPPPTPRTVDLP